MNSSTLPLKYRTIVADPPWRYDEGFPSGVARPDGSLERWTYELPYESMTDDELAEIPVADFADPEGCRLFMWTTNKYLPRSFGLLERWGFKYGQTIVWAKTSHVPPFTTSIAPQASEYLLYGYSGKPAPRMASFPSTVIASPRGFTEHSRKPEGFLDSIPRSSSTVETTTDAVFAPHRRTVRVRFADDVRRLGAKGVLHLHEADREEPRRRAAVPHERRNR